MTSIGGRKDLQPNGAGAAGAAFFLRKALAARGSSSTGPSRLIRVYETQVGFNLPAGETFIFNPPNLDVTAYYELFFHVFIDENATLGIEWNTDLIGLGEAGWVQGARENVLGQTGPEGVVLNSFVLAPQCRFDITAGDGADVTFVRVEIVGK